MYIRIRTTYTVYVVLVICESHTNTLNREGHDLPLRLQHLALRLVPPFPVRGLARLRAVVRALAPAALVEGLPIRPHAAPVVSAAVHLRPALDAHRRSVRGRKQTDFDDLGQVFLRALRRLASRWADAKRCTFCPRLYSVYCLACHPNEHCSASGCHKVACPDHKNEMYWCGACQIRSSSIVDSFRD